MESIERSFACDLCGHDTQKLFCARDYRRPHDRTAYRLNWCAACGLGRVRGDFTSDDVADFFDIPYYTHENNERPIAQSLFDRVFSHLAWRADAGVPFSPGELDGLGDGRVCDIGCGDGANLKLFSAAGFQVVGIEPDPIARAAAGRIAQVFDGTAETLPHEISSKCFDVVLLSHVLDVCRDVRAALANCRAILKPVTGALVVEVPNFAALGFRLYGAEWPWTDIPRHLTFFTERSLCSFLETCGFAVESVRYVGYTRQFSPTWAAAQDAAHRAGGSKKSRKRLPSYAWLLRTVFAADDRKYDSVRIVARPMGITPPATR